MDKLLFQFVGFAVVFSAARLLHLPSLVTGALVVAGVALVHVVYDRFLAARAPGHLGAAAIATDDPLMIRAFAEAKATWGVFLELYRKRPQDAMVKYRLRTRSGSVENVWGDLLELGHDAATVYLRTPPVEECDLGSLRMTVPVEDIVDWQVMLPDDTLRGGFTQQATFRIIERQEGHLPLHLAEQLRRYRPLDT